MQLKAILAGYFSESDAEQDLLTKMDLNDLRDRSFEAK
jgi:hypothetical protein